MHDGFIIHIIPVMIGPEVEARSVDHVKPQFPLILRKRISHGRSGMYTCHVMPYF